MNRAERQFVILLSSNEDPTQRELISECLDQAICFLDASAAVLQLYDGANIRLKSEVNVPEWIRPYLTHSRDRGAAGLCLAKKSPIAISDVRKDRRCDIGLEGYICFAGLLSVPISLHSSVVGILTVLDGLPRRFKDSESKALSYLGANLILTLHHSLYFPELGEQWLNLSRVHAKMLDSEEFGLRASFLIERTRHGKCIYRHPAVSCLGHPLPKGISEPTLLRILDFLQARQEPVSAKQLSIALSISDVTSGVYLSYLVESGLASRKVIHGRVGRPTLVYQPTEALSAISRL